MSFGGTRTTRSPRLDQEALERARDVAAVLEREEALIVELTRAHCEQLRVAGRELARSARPLSSPIEEVTATAVWVCLWGSTPTTITWSPFGFVAERRIASGHASLGASKPRSY